MEHLLGKPWERYASGPDAFDCWGLVRYWYGSYLGIDLPSVLVDVRDTLSVARHIKNAQDGSDWSPLVTPEPNCVVAMGKGSVITHVGIHVDGGYVLHCSSEAGAVVVQALSAIERQWPTTRFYKHILQ